MYVLNIKMKKKIQGILYNVLLWKSKTWVASSNQRVTSSNLWVMSLNPRVTSSNLQIVSLNPGVTSSNPRVRRLRARAARLKALISYDSKD